MVLDLDLATTDRAEQRSTFDRHTVLSKANVGRCQIARSRQLVAGNVVLRDQDRPIAKVFGQRHSDRAADRIEQCDGSRRQRGASTYLGDVEHHRRFVDLVLAPARLRPGALDNRITGRN